MVIKSRFPGKCNACGFRFPAGEDIEWSKSVIGAKHATVAQCVEARKQQEGVKPATKLDLTPISKLLKAAQDRGLKTPKLRVLAIDGRTEVAIGLTVKGRAPGSVTVKVGGIYFGSVLPDGTPTQQVSSDPLLQQHLLQVAKEPAAAAKQYAALMCQCSFCGKALTDEGSVEVGYGPVCAKHWGLPHRALGSPELSPLELLS